MPLTLSLLTAGMPAGRRATAVAIRAAVGGAAGLGGFLAPGAILACFDWRAIFVVCAAAAGLLAVRSGTIGTAQDHAPPRFDVAGSIAATVAVCLSVVGLLSAPDRGWADPLVIGCLAAGPAVGAGFVHLSRSLPVARSLRDQDQRLAAQARHAYAVPMNNACTVLGIVVLATALAVPALTPPKRPRRPARLRFAGIIPTQLTRTSR